MEIDVLASWPMTPLASHTQQELFSMVSAYRAWNMLEPGRMTFKTPNCKQSREIPALPAVEGSRSPTIVGIHPSRGQFPHRTVGVPRQIDFVRNRFSAIDEIDRRLRSLGVTDSTGFLEVLSTPFVHFKNYIRIRKF